jgi:hypothetical protein
MSSSQYIQCMFIAALLSCAPGAWALSVVYCLRFYDIDPHYSRTRSIPFITQSYLSYARRDQLFASSECQLFCCSLNHFFLSKVYRTRFSFPCITLSRSFFKICNFHQFLWLLLCYLCALYCSFIEICFLLVSFLIFTGDITMISCNFLASHYRLISTT